MSRPFLAAAMLSLVACENAPLEQPDRSAANLAASEPAAAVASPIRYENDRFGFSVAVPPGFAARSAPADAGGQAFTDPATGAEFRAFGSLRPSGRSFETITREAVQELNDRSEIAVEGRTYRATGTDEDGRHIHLRIVKGSGNRLVTLVFRYPPEARERLERVAERTLDSLRLTEGMGPVSFRYDPARLLPIPALVAEPPDWRNRAQGLKLIAADRAALMGKAECMYGESGRASPCNPEQEAGLSIALLDHPYEAVRAALTKPPTTAIRLAGREGISWEIGAEGEGADHLLVPLDERTLLVVLQHRGSGNPAPDAVEAVLDSLSIEAAGS